MKSVYHLNIMYVEHHSLVHLSPQNAHALREAQTARMAMSISETLQRLQATKVSNRSGGATGSKGPKTADLEVRHYVPRGENSGWWLLEWHPSHHFPFRCAFFFWGGGSVWMNGDDKNYGTQISLLPGRLGRFLSGWHPSPWNLRCIRSLAMSWMRRWNMWWARFRLTFPYERWDMMVTLQKVFCELPELPESPEFWSIAYMFLGWNPLFGRIFFRFHFFSVCTQGAQWIGAIPGSCQGAEHHEIRQVETWLGRWEGIRDFECPVSLGRHNLGPATSGCSFLKRSATSRSQAFALA